MASLEAVPWHSLYGTYGRATDVPKDIYALRSLDPATRGAARARLSDAIYHQGTRWHVSAHVIPFLVAQIDQLDTADRAALAAMLHAVALGDRTDGDLPFEPDRVFAATGDLTDEQLNTVIQRIYHADDTFIDDVPTELFDQAARRWAADAYVSAARHLTAYRRWLADPDVRVAAHAGAMLAWFTPTDDTVTALLAVPADRAPARASANLALAYLARTDHKIHSGLRQLLASAQAAVAITAATALAYRLGPGLPDSALDILIEAKDSGHLPEAPPGWDRSMRGFVALALQRLGLS